MLLTISLALLAGCHGGKPAAAAAREGAAEEGKGGGSCRCDAHAADHIIVSVLASFAICKVHPGRAITRNCHSLSGTQ